MALCSQGSASPQPGGSTTPAKKIGKFRQTNSTKLGLCDALPMGGEGRHGLEMLVKDQTLDLDMHRNRADMLLLVLLAASNVRNR